MDIHLLIIGTVIARKADQNPALRQNYKAGFEKD